MLDQEIKSEILRIRIAESDKEHLRNYAKLKDKTMSQIIREHIQDL